jgi:hypothetical protein
VTLDQKPGQAHVPLPLPLPLYDVKPPSPPYLAHLFRTDNGSHFAMPSLAERHKTFYIIRSQILPKILPRYCGFVHIRLSVHASQPPQSR